MKYVFFNLCNCYHLFISARGICNARVKMKAKSMGNFNLVQHIFKLIKEKGYVHYARIVDESNTILRGLVLSHPESVEMVRTWPLVLFLYITTRLIIFRYHVLF